MLSQKAIDKMEEWNKIYFDKFLFISNENENGSNIPVSSVSREGYKNTGDGTINLASLMAYIWIGNKLGKEYPITLMDCLLALRRMEKRAYDYFREKFPYLFTEGRKNISYCKGFFVRDDIEDSSVTWGNWRMLNTLENEDPCHSPFVSQDQVWNLNPILSCIMRDEELDEDTRNLAREIGIDINNYIVSNGYTLYNPYLSYIKHMYGYLPPFNYNVQQRKEDRDKHLKYTIKVKRGANNWYYSGGSQAALSAFNNNEYDYKHTLRTFLYRGVVFFLDKIYEPIYKLIMKSDFKHNSYYCYGATSGIWYNKKYNKNFLKRFNKSLEEKDNEIFETNIAPIVLKDIDGINLEKLEDYIENSIPNYNENDSWTNTPIDYLLLYNLYLYKKK